MNVSFPSAVPQARRGWKGWFTFLNESIQLGPAVKKASRKQLRTAQKSFKRLERGFLRVRGGTFPKVPAKKHG